MELWQILLTACGAIITLTTAVNSITNIIAKIKGSGQRSVKNILKPLDDNNSALTANVEDIKTQLSATKAMSMMLSRYILRTDADLMLSMPALDRDDLDRWCVMYEQYKAMGGNGGIETLYHQLKALSVAQFQS